MTEPTRDALHAETLAMLGKFEGGMEPVTRVMRHAAECVKRVPELEAELDKWREREASVCPEDFGFEEVIKTLRAEVERLRAKAEIVDAMDAGRIAAFSKRKDGRVALYAPEHLQDFDAEPFVADTLAAAYAAATREGTDA